VVHSTQTLSTELHYAFPFHYLIHRSGTIVTDKKITQKDRAIHLAYVGGIDKERKVSDTRTDQQNESLFKLLFILSEKYPNARIFSADEILGKSNNPGFKVRAWLKAYLPKSILTAA
jgi:hypothetical protein